MIQIVNDSKQWKGPVVTTLEPLVSFTKAEEYHQDYLVKNTGRGCHIGKPWWITKSAAAPAAAR